MQHHARTELDPLGQFGQHIAASLTDGTFVRLVLSGATDPAAAPGKVLGRLIDIKGKPHLSITSRFDTRDEVKNLPISKAVGWILVQLGSTYRNGLLGTTDRDWQFSRAEGKDPKLVAHKPSTTTAPARQHDKPRKALLDASARDWLRALLITDAQGQVRPGMAHKHAQINRYLEIFSHLATDAGWIGGSAEAAPTEPWTIVDMGCGKGYLTFGLWHLCCRVWKFPVRILGVESRPDLVTQTNEIAKSVGAEQLQFICGQIDSTALPTTRALIALHACDTATDDAIRRGIELGAELILLAPCCHKEARPQLTHPPALAQVLRHGLMEERMAEWATDGLRALFLEWAGYRTKLFEFVSSEHTPKNLMIAAVAEQRPFSDAAARTRLEQFQAFFGIKNHTLDPLLSETPPAPEA